jgi:hypothetical protein
MNDRKVIFRDIEYKPSYLYFNLPFVAHVSKNNPVKFYFLNKNYKTIGNESDEWETYPDIGEYNEIYFFKDCMGIYPWSELFYDKTLFDQYVDMGLFRNTLENKVMFENVFNIEKYIQRVQKIINSGECLNKNLPFFIKTEVF